MRYFTLFIMLVMCLNGCKTDNGIKITYDQVKGVLDFLEEYEYTPAEELAPLRAELTEKAPLPRTDFIEALTGTYLQGGFTRKFHVLLHKRLLEHIKGAEGSGQYNPVEDTFGGYWVLDEKIDLEREMGRIKKLSEFLFQKKIITKQEKGQLNLLIANDQIFEPPLFFIELEKLITQES